VSLVEAGEYAGLWLRETNQRKSLQF